jgi:galactokinase
MDLNYLKQRFAGYFPDTGSDVVAAYAPARINLIGEHTDYNGGLVLPVAVSFGTWMLVRKNDLGLIRLRSENFEQAADIAVGQVTEKHPAGWVNYPLGVMNELIKYGWRPSGLDLLLAGDIPVGAGLASSASVELATATGLTHLFGLDHDMLQLAKLSQKAERDFVGVNCGIMDQFAIALSRKGHAMLLDCRTLKYEFIPIGLDGYHIVIANTGKQRELSMTKYNERVAECAVAVELISRVKPVKSLGELSYQDFVDLSHHIPDITLRKRAKHVVSENQRVSDAANALKKNNLRLFGKLMNASHNSLKYDYEVTGVALDVIVDLARDADGVLGARMTGAGFGGCSVNIVAENALSAFVKQVGDKYQKKTGLRADFYICTANGEMFLTE